MPRHWAPRAVETAVIIALVLIIVACVLLIGTE